MVLLTTFVPLLLVFGKATAQLLTSTVLSSTLSASIEPCALISSSSSALMAAAATSLDAASATETGKPTPISVDPELAIACLQSVPLGADQGVELVAAIRPYAEVQSTLAYLKNPPPGYLLPGVDIMGGLDRISQNITNGNYRNEYEFQVALHKLFLAAHDQHFNFLPDAIGQFSFGFDQKIVSISTDGQNLPQPYLLAEILLAQNTSRFTPSPIMTVNGIDAVSYLQEFSMTAENQDPDALYNFLMSQPANVAANRQSLFNKFPTSTYPGPSIELGFANGTNLTVNTTATLVGNFSGVDSGASFYSHFCDPTVPLPSKSNTTEGSETPADSLPQISGYPTAIIKHSQNVIAGYFLEEAGFEDVAVLIIPSFSPDGMQQELEFSTVARDFLAKCKAAEKKKLVIDVSANGGGLIALGYDIFKQLFPSLEPFGANNFRAPESVNQLGQIISDAWDQNQGNAQVLEQSRTAGPLVYSQEVTVDETAFASWPDRYGPHLIYGDNFTSVSRRNLSNPESLPGFVVSGYQNRTNIAPSPFAAEDIILFYDGACASTCTVFSEFMRQQGGVKTIVAGGRPFQGPMQAVGGVKGSNVYEFKLIFDGAQIALRLTADLKTQHATDAITQLTDLAINRTSNRAPRVNFRNNLRQGDTSLTPLHFVYEAADCRIFYTPEMIVNVTAQWTTVANIAFKGNSSICVQGSTGKASLPNNSTVNSTSNGPSAPTSPSITPSTGGVGTMVLPLSISSTVFISLIAAFYCL